MISITTMKTCKTCKLKKPIIEFYKHLMMGDGYLNICIECTKERIKRHRALNYEKIRAYDIKRSRTEKRREASRRYSAKTRSKGKRYGIDWKEKNPEKRNAHVLLGNAVRSKKIFKGVCEVCGEAKVDAHHDDYSKPLEVRWLCKRHHGEVHRKYK